MTIESSTNIFSTTDLSLAATISLWQPLETIDKTNPKKALFLFRRDDGLDDLVASYWRRELKIEPQAYFNQVKFLKSRLYEENR